MNDNGPLGPPPERDRHGTQQTHERVVTRGDTRGRAHQVVEDQAHEQARGDTTHDREGEGGHEPESQLRERGSCRTEPEQRVDDGANREDPTRRAVTRVARVADIADVTFDRVEIEVDVTGVEFEVAVALPAEERQQQKAAAEDEREEVESCHGARSRGWPTSRRYHPRVGVASPWGGRGPAVWRVVARTARGTVRELRHDRAPVD